MGGACGPYGGRERCAQGFGGKPEGKRPLGRPRRRWDDNIKVGLEEVGKGCGDWMELAQEVAGACEYGNELWGSIKCGEFLD